MKPARERELIVAAYSGWDRKASAAALAQLRAEAPKLAATIKQAFGQRLHGKRAVFVDERVRRLKRPDRGLIASALVAQTTRAFGLAFEEDPEFARTFVYTLLRRATRELSLSHANVGYADQIVLTRIPDAVFDELPGLRKKVAFDRVSGWNLPIATLPKRFVELAPFLRSFEFYNCKLREVPDVLTKCTKLESLQIDSRELARANKHLPNLAKLKELGLTGTTVMKAVPAEIFELTKLETLRLGAAISTLPPAIAKLKNLRVLDLRGSRISKLPPELAELPQLRELAIYVSRRPGDRRLALADIKKLLPKVKLG